MYKVDKNIQKVLANYAKNDLPTYIGTDIIKNEMVQKDLAYFAKHNYIIKKVDNINVIFINTTNIGGIQEHL